MYSQNASVLLYNFYRILSGLTLRIRVKGIETNMMWPNNRQNKVCVPG